MNTTIRPLNVSDDGTLDREAQEALFRKKQQNGFRRTFLGVCLTAYLAICLWRLAVVACALPVGIHYHLILDWPARLFGIFHR